MLNVRLGTGVQDGHREGRRERWDWMGREKCFKLLELRPNPGIANADGAHCVHVTATTFLKAAGPAARWNIALEEWRTQKIGFQLS